MDDIKQKVTEILDNYIMDKKIWDTVPDNPKIIHDLKINSARIVDIILDIEEKYNIEVDDDALEKIVTLNDIVAIIKKIQ